MHDLLRKMLGSYPTRQLSWRLLFSVLLFSSIITLFSAGLQLYLDYQRDMGDIDDRIETIRITHLGSLTTSLWKLDDQQLTTELGSVAQMQDVVAVKIHTDGKAAYVVEHEVSAEERIRTERFPMLYEDDRNRSELGELEIVVSLTGVEQRLIDRALVILGAQALKTFLVSIFILFITHFLIIRHLHVMSAYARDLRIGRLDADMSLDRPPHATNQRDELDEVVDAINGMRRNIQQDVALRERQHAEANLREVEERARVEKKVIERTAQLREKNTFIDNILRYSTDIAIAATDLDYRIRYFNPKAETIFGYSQEEVIGKTVFQMHDIKKIDPSRFDRARANVQATGEHRYEVEHHLNGELRIISARMTGIIDAQGETIGYVLMARDITETRQADIYQKKNETRLRKLLELNREASGLSEKELCTRALDIAVEVTDSVIGYLHMVNENQETIRLVTWNAAALKLCTAVHATHYPISEAGIWADSFRLKKIVIHNDYPNEPSRKGYPEGHFPVYRHMSAPVIDGGKTHMIIGVGNKEAPYDEMDATQLQLVADEVLKFIMRWRAEEALKEARAHAESANRAKSEFLAIMSHEIRTPLNVLLGMSDILQESSLTDEQRGQLEMVHQAGDHLLTLINDVLDLSRIESGAIGLEVQPFQPAKLLNATGDLLRNKVEEKGLTFRQALSPDLPAWVLGDPVRLRQVVVNLIGNALKFTERGRIDLEVDYLPEGSLFQITVLDTGVGIAPDHMEHIFDKFSQADASISRRYGGAGLGLAISRNLVELMGGKITVESQLDQGSAFKVTLSLAVCEAPTAPPTVAAPSPTPLQDEQPLRILLVEDSVENQEVIKAYLKQTPWRLEVAMDGEAGVERIKRGDLDLILMDILMPMMDGYTATRTIRQWEEQEGQPRIPILALSAHALESEKKQSLDAGCDAHLTKPIRKRPLLDAIRQHAQTATTDSL